MSFDQERVKQIIADAMVEFGKAYTIGYVKAVVHKIREESEGEEAPPVFLLVKPPEPEIFKQGWLVKKGAVVKNWKKRWFVVDKNYRVAYYKGEHDHEIDPKTKKPKKKPQGDFSCYGYKVKKDDDKESKEHTLKLKPYWDDDYAKRTYYVQCAGKEDYDSWKKMFQECCYNATNPMHKDPVRRAAFEAAYIAMENYWYFYATGSEGDMLAYVTFRRVERLVLNDAYASIPNNPLRWKVIDKMRSVVGGLIAAPVDAAWKGASAGIDKIEKPTEDKIRAAVGPLFDAIKKIKQTVEAKFQEKVVPVIAALMAPVAEKLMPKISVPLIKSQKDLIEEFVKHASDESRGSWYLYWDLRKRENEYDTVLEVARLLLDEWELNNLPSNIMDSCFSLLEAARYNYKHKDDKKIEVTCTKLLHDCLVEQHRLLTWLVELLVLKPFNEKFGLVLDELCSPLMELVPEAVLEFLSPVDIIKEMASKAVSAAIQGAITAGDQASVPEKMAGYFKDQNVVVDSSNLANLQKQAQSAAQGEEKKPDKAEAEPTAELVRQPSKVPMEAVDSDSEPDTPASPKAAGDSAATVAEPKAETAEPKAEPAAAEPKEEPKEVVAEPKEEAAATKEEAAEPTSA